MRKYRIIVILVLAAAALWSVGCGVSGGKPGSVEPSAGPQITPEGVRFSLYSTKVKKVNIAGTFNNWSMTADPLYDRDGSGMWTIVLPLPPGKYEYKLIIDGDEWIPDPANPTTTDDGFGGYNSVISVE
jgi:1,4-alpha-glucan branching enzyme